MILDDWGDWAELSDWSKCGDWGKWDDWVKWSVWGDLYNLDNFGNLCYLGSLVN